MSSGLGVRRRQPHMGSLTLLRFVGAKCVGGDGKGLGRDQPSADRVVQVSGRVCAARLPEESWSSKRWEAVWSPGGLCMMPPQSASHACAS